MGRRKISRGAARKIARERIDLLFQMTEEVERRGRPDLARRYVDLALKIGMRYNVSVSAWKRRFCPQCRSYYRFPLNASVRLRRGRMIITCLNCGRISRYPYRR